MNKNIQIDGLKELDDLIKGLESQYKYIDDLGGQEINLNSVSLFLPDVSYLHQDSEGQTAEESAKFERDNKQIFDFLRNLEYELNTRLGQ